MATVVFHWENHPSLHSPHIVKKLLNRWSFTCKAFGVYNLIAVTDEPLKLSDAEINFSTATSLSEALKGKDNIIYLEEGGTPLTTFAHSVNATYVFGSDYGELDVDNCVSINTRIPLHAEVACGIVLEHRSTQWLLR